MVHFYGIYGVGAVLLIIALRFFNKNIYTLFFGGCLVGSVIEYIMSYIGEILFDARWWDYSDKFLNINGRICLLYTVFWGILSIMLIKVINPQIDKFIDYSVKKVNIKALRVLVLAIILFILYDTVISGIAMDAFLTRISVEFDLDVKNKESVIQHYNDIYGNEWKKKIVEKYWGNEKMLKTFPNVTINLADGTVLYVKTLLPDIQTYVYKFSK